MADLYVYNYSGETAWPNNVFARMLCRCVSVFVVNTSVAVSSALLGARSLEWNSMYGRVGINHTQRPGASPRDDKKTFVLTRTTEETLECLTKQVLDHFSPTGAHDSSPLVYKMQSEYAQMRNVALVSLLDQPQQITWMQIHVWSLHNEGNPHNDHKNYSSRVVLVPQVQGVSHISLFTSHI